MQIEVRCFASVREEIGKRSLMCELDGEPTVKDLLGVIEFEYPGLDGTLLDDEQEITRHITVLVNGRNITHREGAMTRLNDGDRLAIMPPVTGG